jgi:hypothetical protein
MVKRITKTYRVRYVLYAGVKIVEARSPDEAAEIVNEMSDDELMDGAYIDVPVVNGADDVGEVED